MAGAIGVVAFNVAWAGITIGWWTAIPIVIVGVYLFKIDEL